MSQLQRYTVNHADLEVSLLARFGFSYKVISSRTGYTPNQIRYRLLRSKIKLGDYRNGTSNYSRLLIKGSEKFSINMLRKTVQKELKNQFSQLGYDVIDV